MESQFDVNNITPLVSSDIFKVFKDEVISILLNMCSEYNLEQEKIIDKYLPNIMNIGVKLGVKKKNKRVLPKEVQCMGRKIDGEQCTRSRRPGTDYCLSHHKRLPHGRIDDTSYVKKIKGRRGRKRKSNNEYIETHIEKINGVDYLVDDYDNVFKYDLNESEYLGKKHQLITSSCSSCCV